MGKRLEEKEMLAEIHLRNIIAKYCDLNERLGTLSLRA